MAKTLVPKTADYTITSGDANGTKIFTNLGASTDIVFILPAPSAGLEVNIANTELSQYKVSVIGKITAVAAPLCLLYRILIRNNSIHLNMFFCHNIEQLRIHLGYGISRLLIFINIMFWLKLILRRGFDIIYHVLLSRPYPA